MMIIEPFAFAGARCSVHLGPSQGPGASNSSMTSRSAQQHEHVKEPAAVNADTWPKIEGLLAASLK